VPSEERRTSFLCRVSGDVSLREIHALEGQSVSFTFDVSER
jgi:hypothetical protein